MKLNLNALLIAAVLTLASPSVLGYTHEKCISGAGPTLVMRCFFGHDAMDYIQLNAMGYRCILPTPPSPPTEFALHYLWSPFPHQVPHTYDLGYFVGCQAGVWNWGSYAKLFNGDGTTFVPAPKYGHVTTTGCGGGCPPCP